MSMIFEKVNYIYGQGGKNAVHALSDISLTIDKHEFIGMIGHTGSGKSTLVQHMNGLLFPTNGTISVDGIITNAEKADLKTLRRKVGLVFQYPEDQLFEETIAKDVAFGPKNLGLSEEETEERVRESLDAVGLDYDTYKDVSPFEISGGQKRRVAIAGVLALRPEYLVLDEPTAGLDPMGRDEILDEIETLYENRPELTIVLVSHSMEDIARFATRLIVIDQGKIAMDGEPHEIFSREDALEEIGLSIPQVTKLMRRMKREGAQMDDRKITVEEAYRELHRYLSEKSGKPGNTDVAQTKSDGEVTL